MSFFILDVVLSPLVVAPLFCILYGRVDIKFVPNHLDPGSFQKE